MSTRRRLTVALVIVLLLSTGKAGPVVGSEGASEFERLFDGVTGITLSGAPGALVYSGNAVPLVLSGASAAPPYSAVLAGVEYGKGLMIAVCHDSFLGDGTFELLDNKQFMSNIFVRQAQRKVLISTSHGEFFTRGNSGRFASFCATKGFSVAFGETALTASSLAGVGILISAAAWRDFSDSEVQAVATFVSEGGVFIVCGVGWSWVAYHPGKTLDDYPANKVSSLFGIRFVDGVVGEPQESLLSGASVFRLFYPHALSHSFSKDSALRIISDDLEAYGSALSAVWASSPERLDIWVSCLESLYKNATQVPQAERDEVFSIVEQLITKYPTCFQKNRALNAQTEATSIWIREKMTVLLYAYALPLNTDRAARVARALALQGTYSSIWEEYGVLILDNNSLYEKNLQVIYDLLKSMPREAHDLKLVLVAKLLGAPVGGLYLLHPDEENLIYDMGAAFAAHTDIGYAIDLWEVRVDQEYENPFPGDAPARQFPVFSSALAHELTHVIDGTSVYADSVLYAERQRLLGNAGDNPLNYLRSMFEEGFFTRAQGEFLASIGNQYFCDSWNTLTLATNRFDAGYAQPLNQFLFFVRILSMGTSTSPFYGLADSGTKLTKTNVQIRRNVNGRVVRIDDQANRRTFTFTLDDRGDVVKYEAAVPSYALVTTAAPLAGGSITASPIGPSYVAGTLVTLGAVPATGWRFTGWTGATPDVADPLKATVILDADKVVTATFQPIVNPPPVPALLSPTDGSTVTTLTAMLSWMPAPGATTYSIALDTSSSFANPVAWSTPSTSQTTGALSEDATYYWRVASVNEGGSSAWSPAYAFSTRKRQVTLTLTLQLGNTRMLVTGSDGMRATVALDAAPVLGAGNRTLVPVRAVAEAMGGTVDWDPVTRTAGVTVRSNTLELTLGKNTAFFNGMATPIDVDPKVLPLIVNGRTMLPLRFVVESLGADVSYDQATKTITITYTKT